MSDANLFCHWSVNDTIRAHAWGVHLDTSSVNELKDLEFCLPCKGAYYDMNDRCYYCGRKRKPAAKLLIGVERFEPYDGTK